MKRPDIAAEHAYVDDKRVVGLKIQTETYELDSLLTDDDLAILALDALPTVPDQRSLIAGTCLVMPAQGNGGQGNGDGQELEFPCPEFLCPKCRPVSLKAVENRRWW